MDLRAFTIGPGKQSELDESNFIELGLHSDKDLIHNNRYYGSQYKNQTHLLNELLNLQRIESVLQLCTQANTNRILRCK